MTERDMIIRGCENWVNNHKDEDLLLEYSSVVELLAMLKEQEAKIGHWIDTTKVIGFPRVECSVCGSGQGAIWMDYCPICGAKMEGR